MSSFFTVPGAQKKRKRPEISEQPKKRVAASKSAGKGPSKNAGPTKKRVERDDESISGSDSDDDGSLDSASIASDVEMEDNESDDEEDETAADRRRRLAERYLENIKEHVDVTGFDAADIDRDLIAERLQEDVAEGKGRVYRQLASEFAFDNVSRTFFRSNTNAVTAIATTRRKPKKPPAPPKKQPSLEKWIKGDTRKSKDKNYQRHTDRILAVAASPDGKYVATGGADNKLIIYDAHTLKPIKVWTHHRDSVTGLVFRRGTNQLYSCSKDRTVKVWSLDEMAYVESLFGHQDEILDVDALAQERCVSVGARDRTARLWKVAEETQLVFRGGAVDKKSRPNGVNPRSLLHEGSMDRVAMIDDDLFVTGSDNGALALWSVQKKKPVYIEPIAHGIDPALDPEEASAEQNPDPQIVPPPTPRWITAIRTIPYSDVILTGSWDGHIRVWQLSEDKRKIEFRGVLSKPEDQEEESTEENAQGPINGVVNDIDLYERGDRGKDGLCVVVAVGKEHRLGRWNPPAKVGRNGGVVFEIPRIQRQMVNGANESSGAEQDE
ncbi:pre-rRNA processing protein [Fusarium chlamydosporum]